MINGVIKGKIVSRKRFADGQAAQYCAQFTVEVERWVDGEKIIQVFVVYAPSFMDKRLEFWMREETKFITVAFNQMSVVQSNTNKDHHYIALRASELGN